MRWIEKALVAVNDSKAALHAFMEALRLSLAFGFRLDAVCVAPPYQGDLSLVGVKELKRCHTEPCRTVLDEAVGLAEEAGAGLATFQAEGDRLDAILHVAANGAYDLIILGQGRGCYPWTAVGSLTAGLLRNSPVDLLFIPRDQPVRLNRVLRACNRSRSLSSKAPFLPDGPQTPRNAQTGTAAEVPQTAETAPPFFASRASTNPHPSLRSETEPCETLVGKASCRSLLQQVRRVDADLIVFEHGDGREVWWTPFVGTTAFRVVRKSNRPVWIEKAPGRQVR